MPQGPRNLFQIVGKRAWLLSLLQLTAFYMMWLDMSRAISRSIALSCRAYFFGNFCLKLQAFNFSFHLSMCVGDLINTKIAFFFPTLWYTPTEKKGAPFVKASPHSPPQRLFSLNINYSNLFRKKKRCQGKHFISFLEFKEKKNIRQI